MRAVFIVSGKEVSANPANARKNVDSLGRAETRSQPHKTSQRRVTRQPIHSISGRGHSPDKYSPDSLGNKGMRQRISIFLRASGTRAMALEKRFDWLQIKRSNKTLVLIVQRAELSTSCRKQADPMLKKLSYWVATS